MDTWENSKHTHTQTATAVALQMIQKPRSKNYNEHPAQ